MNYKKLNFVIQHLETVIRLTYLIKRKIMFLMCYSEKCPRHK